MTHPRPDLRFTLLLLSVAALFCLLRWFHITADFPLGIENTGFMYTDEGWYVNAAINLHNFGKWHLEGDFNPAVNLPVSHAVQAAVFVLFGMSLTAARGTAVVCFIMLLAAAYFFVNKYAGRLSAAFTVFLLSTGFMPFVYSRLAILEIMMLCFVVTSFLLAVSFRRRNNLLIISCASLLLAVALLVKSTAVFAVPVMMYLSARRAGDTREKIILPLVSVAAVCIPVATWNYFAHASFPADFHYFITANFIDRMNLKPSAVAGNTAFCFVNALRSEPVIFPLGVILCITLLIRSGEFRRNALVHVSLLWLIVYTAIIGSTSYQPLRYFLPLTVPAAFLFGSALVAIRHHLQKNIFLPVMFSVVAYVLAFNGYNIIRYLVTAESTFMTMANEVKRIVNLDGSGNIVMGNFANSVSLASGIRSINTSGTKTIEWKLKTYHPRFYLSLGYEPAIIREIFKQHTLQPVGEWDVFNNFFRDKSVHLFRLDPPGDRNVP